MTHSTKFLALLAAGLLAFAAGCANAPVDITNGTLAGTNGMTLYTFDKDVAGSGKSACNGPCAKNWPPLLVGAEGTAAGYYSIVTRDDGGRQWAYDGKPLYFWAKDSKPGDKTGDGFNNAWHVARMAKPEAPVSGGY